MCSGQIGPTSEQTQCLQRNAQDFIQEITGSCSLEAIAGGDVSPFCGIALWPKENKFFSC